MVSVVVIVNVAADLGVARGSGGTGVLRRGFVGQLGQSGLELSADADVLVETRDLNVQLGPLFLLFVLLLALTAVYEHGSIGEGLLMLISHLPGRGHRSLGGFLCRDLHGQLLRLLKHRWRLRLRLWLRGLGLRDGLSLWGHHMFSERIPPMKRSVHALHHQAFHPPSTSSHAADHLHAVSLAQCGAVLGCRRQRLTDLLQGLVHHGGAVWLEGLDRQLHHACDQLGTAASDAAVAVAGQVGRAGGRAEGVGGVRRRRARHVVPQHVGRGRVAPHVGPLLFGVGQLRCADRVGDGASYSIAASASIFAGGMTGALAAGWSSLVRAVRYWLTVADLQNIQQNIKNSKY